ncbi:UvrD-family helicase [Yasminevirus sp. GU-2018]|uniref:UvrD-family helicase n=1 Tax=Yasminevirus sp. GU-2018 TaxID=2420051 RepID=A0A5K0UAF8_9VIRU|nr:UvrD-family helicase [Yasminevirus sp. GU-2018]
MDISSFFPIINASEEEQAIDEYKRCVFNLAQKGYLTQQQSSFLINFVKTMGTICNVKWLLTQIETFQSENDKKSKPGKDPQVIEFKKIIGRVFSKILKYTETEDDDTGETSGGELRINKNIRYYLTRSDTISPTPEQKKAMQVLYDFVIDHTKNTMGLYGFAGTGKTTTVVEFVSYMILNGYLHSVAFTAPTNKAVNVIKNKFKLHLKRILETRFNKEVDDAFNFDDELDYLEQRGVVIKFITIHKLLMFQTDYSIDGGMIFVRGDKAESLISQFEFVVIDECSMISMEMIDNIFEEVRNINKLATSKSKGYVSPPKIVFTGDPAQLPPVNEEDSSIFCKTEGELLFKDYMEAMSYKFDRMVVSDTISLMKQKYKALLGDLCKMNSILLTHVVRSRLDNVTKVCHEFRKWIKSDDLPALEKFKDKAGVYFYNNDQAVDKVRSDWFKKFLQSIKDGQNCIIITWTNRQTDIYNDTIRRQIFKGKKLNKFEPNDILMLSEFYGLDLGEDFVKQRLYTSEQIKVVSTKMSLVPINMFEMVTNYGLRHMKQVVKIEGRIKTLIDGLNEFYCKDVKFMCWVLKVHKFGEEEDHTMSLIVIDDEAREKYEKHKADTSLAIKNFSKQMLNQYRTEQRKVESCIIKPLWKQWNKIFVEPFASVNYGYSITCHKGQGSSFYDVFIDLDDILLNTQRPVEAKKCAYTAATRAVNELNVLI